MNSQSWKKLFMPKIKTKSEKSISIFEDSVDTDFIIANSVSTISVSNLFVDFFVRSSYVVDYLFCISLTSFFFDTPYTELEEA